MSWKILFFSVLLSSCTVAAQEAKHSVVGADLSLVCPLVQGQQAPFPGVLLSTKASAAVIAEYSLFDERLKIEVENANRLMQVKADFEIKEHESKFATEKSILAAQVESRNEKINMLERNLKKSEDEARRLAEDAPNRVTWFGIGFAGGILFTIATAYAIGQVVN
jgi:hypothetical protein